MKPFRTLDTFDMTSVYTIQTPEDKSHIHLEDTAMLVFTDFMKYQPRMLEESASVDEALAMMRKTHVRMNLVIDKEEHFKGIISLLDLQSSKVMSASTKLGLARDDLSVREVMLPKEKLHALTMSELRKASIGDVVKTMQYYGDQHALVVDDTDGQVLRGIVSASDIARALHIPLLIGDRANSFADIYRALH
jgi:DeoR family transcriptional regulator, catabolite repression regulator